MYSNIFFKTLRDGRRSMLLFAFAQFVFGIYLALLFPDVATSFAQMVDDLPDFIQAFARQRGVSSPHPKASGHHRVRTVSSRRS